MRLLTLAEIVAIHDRVLQATGGAPGVRDQNALASAVAQPGMTFGGADLYPTLVEKAAALGFSLIQNHSFIDGNKRVGFAGMDTFLRLNGMKIQAPIDESERVILEVASGLRKRPELLDWLRTVLQPL